MIKKTLVFILCLVVIFSMTSCTKTCYISYILDRDGYRFEKRLDEIVTALQDNDEDALKSVFSKSAIEKDEDFEENLDEIFAYFEGEFVSVIDEAIEAHDSKLPEGTKEIIMATCDIETTELRYRIYFIDVITNTEEADEVGVSCLYIIKYDEDPSEHAYRGDYKETPGINIATPRPE